MSLISLPYELKLMITSYLTNFELFCFMLSSRKLLLQRRDLNKRKSVKEHMYTKLSHERGIGGRQFLRAKKNGMAASTDISILIELLPGACAVNDLSFINSVLYHPKLEGRGVAEALMITLINNNLELADLLYSHLRSDNSLKFHSCLKKLIKLKCNYKTLLWWHKYFGSKYNTRLVKYAFYHDNDEAIKFLYKHGAKWFPNCGVLIDKLVKREKDAWDITDYLTPYARKDKYSWNDDLFYLIKQGKFSTTERVMKLAELQVTEEIISLIKQGKLNTLDCVVNLADLEIDEETISKVSCEDEEVMTWLRMTKK